MNLWLIPLFPLLGFLINGIWGRRFSKTLVGLFAIGSVVASFVYVLWTLSALYPLTTAHAETYFTWIHSGSLQIGFDLTVDRLTAVMLLVVTGVGLLIHIYSIGYMAHEGGYYRFFSLLNLFMFFMLLLVLASNFLVLFVGWEGVGLCSYLLIGFYFGEDVANNAGTKAFVVNQNRRFWVLAWHVAACSSLPHAGFRHHCFRSCVYAYRGERGRPDGDHASVIRGRDR